MIDVLRLALVRRDQLSQELAELDRFVRMAEELLRSSGRTQEVPEVDPLQARFNSGEVLPPARGNGDEAEPLRLVGM